MSGSVIVASYWIWSWSSGVRRSTMCIWVLVGTEVARDDTIVIGVWPLKLVVSMTRVLPSKWPREEPSQVCITPGSGGRPSSGMMRVSCTISSWITT